MPSADKLPPDWSRAHGSPLFQGLIKQTDSDFEVTEELGFACSGQGEHDFLWIEKQGTNTAWLARVLARHAGIQARDVGYAGLKDRHAITRQWFSVRRPTGAGTDWDGFDVPGVRILECERHDRKLKRGAHKGNRFRIAVRGELPATALVDERLSSIRDSGNPNYFGMQRFGRDGANLALAESLFGGGRLKRDQRSIALSAARALVFNHVLMNRVRDGTWDRPIGGDVFNLDGTNSVFAGDADDQDIVGRMQDLDIHPTGPLWGKGELQSGDRTAAMEQKVADEFPIFRDGLVRAGVSMSRRPLRAVVRELGWEIGENVLWLDFRLGRGVYATTVIHEIADIGQ